MGAVGAMGSVAPPTGTGSVLTGATRSHSVGTRPAAGPFGSNRWSGLRAPPPSSGFVSGVCVCREAVGLRVLLENGIEDEKASAGCPPDDRESSLDRP